jgi:hypothetical protein
MSTPRGLYINLTGNVNNEPPQPPSNIDMAVKEVGSGYSSEVALEKASDSMESGLPRLAAMTGPYGIFGSWRPCLGP